MVEALEPGEAELANPLSRQLAAGALDRRRNAIDEGIEVVAGDRTLVGGARQRVTELRRLEPLPLPAPLADPEALGDDALVGGEAVAAGGAGAAAAHGGAVVGGAGLRDACGGAADGADHVEEVY